MDDKKVNLIEVAEGEYCAYMRIIGRATFMVAGDFKKYICKELEQDKSVLIDMSKCTTTDSTFIGTITSLTVKQNKIKPGMIKLFNVSTHVCDIMETLGLKAVLDIVNCQEEDCCEFSKLRTANHGKIEISDLMLDAHQTLASINEENKIEFKNVIEHLQNQID